MTNKPSDKPRDLDVLATPEKWYLKSDNEGAARRALYAVRAQLDKNLESSEDRIHRSF